MSSLPPASLRSDSGYTNLRCDEKMPPRAFIRQLSIYSSRSLGYSRSSKFRLLCRLKKGGTTYSREATSTEQQQTKATAHRQGIRPENKGCLQRGKRTEVLWWTVSLSLPLLLPRSSGRLRVRTRKAGRSWGWESEGVRKRNVEVVQKNHTGVNHPRALPPFAPSSPRRWCKAYFVSFLGDFFGNF